ncbi:hypothetical protein [Microbacterium sp. NPDC079176]|uniref:hypothetical protein n=1 Tax=Microbacterium sp. NPDC079176 TaxID=3154768 RepID=UPI003425A916
MTEKNRVRLQRTQVGRDTGTGREMGKPSDGEVFVLLKGKFVSLSVPQKEALGVRVGRRGGLYPSTKPLKLKKLEGSMYIGSSDAVVVMKVVQAYMAVLKDLGFVQSEIIAVEGGSVWVKFKQWTVKVAEKRKVRVAATQLLSGLEGFTVDKFQADNTGTHAKSVAELAESTKHLDSFSFDSGPLQYVQYTDEEGKMHARARVIGSKDVASNRLGEDVVRDPKKMLGVLGQKNDSIKAVPEE